MVSFLYCVTNCECVFQVLCCQGLPLCNAAVKPTSLVTTVYHNKLILFTLETHVCDTFIHRTNRPTVAVRVDSNIHLKYGNMECHKFLQIWIYHTKTETSDISTSAGVSKPFADILIFIRCRLGILKNQLYLRIVCIV